MAELGRPADQAALDASIFHFENVAINDSDTMVATAYWRDGEVHPVLIEGGVAVRLDSIVDNLGDWQLLAVAGISSSGTIAVTGTPKVDDAHDAAYGGTPAPHVLMLVPASRP